MNTNQTDLSGVFAMLEEIKSDIKNNAQQPAAKLDIEAVSNLAETMRETIEEARRPLAVEKRLTINFAGSHSVIFTIAAIIVVIVLLIIIPIQQKELSKRTDNDLKYRYIEMRGVATPEDMLMLREIFDFNRNADSIRLIRDRVEKYEKLVRQQAEIEARVQLNNQKAKELDEAAKQLK